MAVMHKIKAHLYDNALTENPNDLVARVVSEKSLSVAEAGAFIAQAVDIKTGSVNDHLTPNRNLKILGSKLKIAGEDEANGVYFVPQGGGERRNVAKAGRRRGELCLPAMFDNFKDYGGHPASLGRALPNLLMRSVC